MGPSRHTTLPSHQCVELWATCPPIPVVVSAASLFRCAFLPSFFAIIWFHYLVVFTLPLLSDLPHCGLLRASHAPRLCPFALYQGGQLACVRAREF